MAGGTGNYLFDIKEKYPKVEILINEFKNQILKLEKKLLKIIWKIYLL